VSRTALRAFWLGIVPALAAAVVVRWMVPGAGSGASGVLGWIALSYRRAPVFFYAALFLVFSAQMHVWIDRVPGGRLLPGRPDEPHSAGARGALRGLAGLIATLALAGGLAFALRTRVAQSYLVVGSSMIPTLSPGDRILGNRMARGKLPRRGDIVVFRSRAVGLTPGPDVPEYLIKRVIGLPGDVVEMHASTPVVDGWEVPSCDAGPFVSMLPGGTLAFNGYLRIEFLGGRPYPSTRVAMVPPVEPVRVRDGEVFVLGDNRAASLDSRSFRGVPIAAIEARADRFLVGTRRDGDADWGRFFRPLDGVGLAPDGLDDHELERSSAKCLASAPSVTEPPPPPADDGSSVGRQAANRPH